MNWQSFLSGLALGNFTMLMIMLFIASRERKRKDINMILEKFMKNLVEQEQNKLNRW